MCQVFLSHFYANNKQILDAGFLMLDFKKNFFPAKNGIFDQHRASSTQYLYASSCEIDKLIQTCRPEILHIVYLLSWPLGKLFPKSLEITWSYCLHPFVMLVLYSWRIMKFFISLWAGYNLHYSPTVNLWTFEPWTVNLWTVNLEPLNREPLNLCLWGRLVPS